MWLFPLTFICAAVVGASAMVMGASLSLFANRWISLIIYAIFPPILWYQVLLGLGMKLSPKLKVLWGVVAVMMVYSLMSVLSGLMGMLIGHPNLLCLPAVYWFGAPFCFLLGILWRKTNWNKPGTGQ